MRAREGGDAGALKRYAPHSNGRRHARRGHSSRTTRRRKHYLARRETSPSARGDRTATSRWRCAIHVPLPRRGAAPRLLLASKCHSTLTLTRCRTGSRGAASEGPRVHNLCTPLHRGCGRASFLRPLPPSPASCTAWCAQARRRCWHPGPETRASACGMPPPPPASSPCGGLATSCDPAAGPQPAHSPTTRARSLTAATAAPQVTCLEWLPDSRSAIAQGSEDLCVRLWDVREDSMQPAATLGGYTYFPVRPPPPRADPTRASPRTPASPGAVSWH